MQSSLWQKMIALACLAGPGAVLGGLAPARKYAFGFDEQALVSAVYVEQPQDHFDTKNSNTWQQAYFVNDDHWDGAVDSPIFVYIGGEGPLGSSSVTSNFVTDVLEKYNGLMFGVEHRYYGCHNASSCPYNYSNPEDGHLQYCTSQQALADLASFHTFATQKYNISNSAKWIGIGGSYPGMLAGFVRAVYPDLFFASVASSAPIHGVLDMTAFQDVVSRAYAMNVEGIEGSPGCAKIIADGHIGVDEDLQTSAGRRRLATLFPKVVESAAWLADRQNQITFAGCGVASFPAQANKPGCAGEGCDISKICAILINATGTPIERLAVLVDKQLQGLQMVNSCEMDWEMPGDIPPADENYWGYQTCNEFGFYQTCEYGTDCFYTQELVSFSNPLTQPDSFCKEQFGITRSQTERRIEQTNAFYTKRLRSATQILWVNGDVDPWHAQSVLSEPVAGQPVIFPVKGARHCAWMAAEKDSDQQSLKDARKAIWNQLDLWLGA